MYRIFGCWFLGLWIATSAVPYVLAGFDARSTNAPEKKIDAKAPKPVLTYTLPDLDRASTPDDMSDIIM